MTNESARLPSPAQIGFAVQDVDATMRSYLDRFGLDGTIELIELNEKTAYRYRGRLSQCVLKIGVIPLGTVDLEFIEVVSGEHPARDFLAENDEGVNHLGFFVQDFTSVVAAIPGGTTQPVIEGTFETEAGVRGRFVYLDNLAGGPMYEIMALEA